MDVTNIKRAWLHLTGSDQPIPIADLRVGPLGGGSPRGLWYSTVRSSPTRHMGASRDFHGLRISLARSFTPWSAVQRIVVTDVVGVSEDETF